MPTATIIKPNENKESFKDRINPLPEVVRTPSGTALIEIQGTINVGERPLTVGASGDLGIQIRDEDNVDEQDEDKENSFNPFERRTLGKFDFSNAGAGEVVLDIGDHQRLRGKIVKLKSPLAVLEMNKGHGSTQLASQQVEHNTFVANDNDAEVTIPILEVITHKIVFSTRPEPLIYKV